MLGPSFSVELIFLKIYPANSFYLMLFIFSVVIDVLRVEVRHFVLFPVFLLFILLVDQNQGPDSPNKLGSATHLQKANERKYSEKQKK